MKNRVVNNCIYGRYEYPPQRVSHAVNMLLTHPNALCAGAGNLYILNIFKNVSIWTLWTEPCN